MKLFVLTALFSGSSALSLAEWRAQSIYQVLTDRFARTDGSTTAPCNPGDGIYCGGSWQGIIDHLDYIQGLGALHARGMYLMVDIVTNHMAYEGCGTCVNYSIFDPFSSSSYFHPYCAIDYSNQTSIETCWEGDNIVSLPDLRTEDQDVRGVWNSWISNLISTYSIDGLRVDSVKHQETSFWPQFETAASGIYMAGEVLDGDPAYVTPYQDYISGLLNYPAYYWITQAFQSTSGSISNLANGINTMKSMAANLSLYASFLENHDQERFPYLTSDITLAKNAIAFTHLMDGIPIIYEGQEQHYSGGATPYNREAIWLSGYNTSTVLYSFIGALNKIRSRAIRQDGNYLEYNAWPIYSDGHNIAMRKGFNGYQIVSIYSNVGSGANYSMTLSSSNTGYSPSEELVEVLGCTQVATDSSGNLAVSSTSGEPQVFYPLAGLSGSGICSSLTGGATVPPGSSQITASKVVATTSFNLKIATTACSTASAAMVFNEYTDTVYRDMTKTSGSIPALGSCDPDGTIALSAP